MTQQDNAGGQPGFQHVRYAGDQAKDDASMAQLDAMTQIQGNPALDVATFGVYGRSVEANATASAQALATRQATALDARLAQGLTTQSGPNVAGANYQRFSHPQLHGMVNNNMDPTGAYQTGDVWTQAGNGYADTANAIAGLVSASESGWQGAAGDAMRSGMTQTAAWFGAASHGAQATGNHMYLQSEAASAAKNSMPPPVAFNPNDAVKAMLTGGSGAFGQNIARQAQAAEDARQQAVHAVQTYDTALGHTSGSMPAFAPPPQVAPANSGQVSVQPTSTAGTHLPVSSGRARPSTVVLSRSAGSPSGASGFTPPTGAGAVPAGADTGTAGYVGGGSGTPPVNSQIPPAQAAGPNGGVTPVVDVAGGMPGAAGLGQPGSEQFRSGIGFGGGPGGVGSRPGVGSAAQAGIKGAAGEQNGGARSGAGALAAEEAAIERGVVAGRPGGSGTTGMAGVGQGTKKDEDKEHKAAAYLRDNNADDVFTDGMPRTAPPTIGE